MIALTALAFQLTWNSRAPLPEPRAGLLHAVSGGKLLAAGGAYWKDNRKIWSRRMDLYDAATNSWSPGPPMPHSRADSASVAAGDEILFLGGSSDGEVLSDVLALTKGGAWEPRPAMQLPGLRSYPRAAAHGRKIYLFGGLERLGDMQSIHSEVHVWDPDRPDAGWQPISRLPGPPRSNYALAVLGSHAYIFGGVAAPDGAMRNLSDAWSYDFDRNEWRELPGTPVPNRAWNAAAEKDSILILGGYTSDFCKDVLRFTPATGKYEAGTPLPQGLADIQFLWLDKDLYVTGGESGMKIRSGNTWQGVLR